MQDGLFTTGPGRPAGASGPASPSLGLGAGTTSAMVVGKKSGKRTLAEVMDDDMAAKRKRQEEAAGGSPATATATPRMPTTSRFFHAGQRSVSDPRGSRRWSSAVAASTTTTRSSAAASASVPGSASQPVAGSSGLSCREKEMGQMHLRQEKENVPCEESADADDVDVSEDEDVDMDMGAPDAVAQEDGYMSPTESTQWNWDSPDISSPLRPGVRRKGGGAAVDGDEDGWEDGIDADVLSSSPIARTNAHTRLHMRKLPSMVVERVVSRPLPLRPVVNTSFSARNNRRKSLGGSSNRECKKKNKKNANSDEGVDTDTDIDTRQGRGGPDLRDVFDDWDEITSGGEDLSEDDDAYVDGERDVIDSTASSTPGPITPATEYDEGGHDHDHGHTVLAYESTSEELEDEDVDEDGERAAGAAAAAARDATVAHGWWQRWARSSGTSVSVSAGIGSGSGSGSRPDPGGHRDRVRVFSPSFHFCGLFDQCTHVHSVDCLPFSSPTILLSRPGSLMWCSVLLSGLRAGCWSLLVVVGHTTSCPLTTLLHHSAHSAAGCGHLPIAPCSAGGNNQPQRPQQQHEPQAHLRRRETTMTPDGRQRPPRGLADLQQRPHSAPQGSKRKRLGFAVEDLRPTASGRSRILAFSSSSSEDVKTTPQLGAGGANARRGSGSGAMRPASTTEYGGSRNRRVSGKDATATAATVSTRNRLELEQFRCVSARSLRGLCAAHLVWWWRR